MNVADGPDVAASRVRVLLVDDHASVRTGLQVVLDLEEDLEVCGTADTGGRGVALAAQLAPDVVLMDVSMPGMDGFTATSLIRGTPRAPAVVMLSAARSRSDVRRAEDVGAAGYLLKSDPTDQLLTCVRAAASGGGLQ